MRSGSVYLVQGLETLRVKIGKSTPGRQLKKRLSTHRTGSGELQRTLVAFDTPDAKEAKKIEDAWKRRYSHRRTHREWYEFPDAGSLAEAIAWLKSQHAVSAQESEVSGQKELELWLQPRTVGDFVLTEIREEGKQYHFTNAKEPIVAGQAAAIDINFAVAPLAAPFGVVFSFCLIPDVRREKFIVVINDGDASVRCKSLSEMFQARRGS